ncbi:hypothetical protein GOFOIKOB_2735 [Methylobacterium tardum]|nr:hypothetical protein GOFOIKOB_2735 [Methylobacterium tardum]
MRRRAILIGPVTALIGGVLPRAVRALPRDGALSSPEPEHAQNTLR